MEQTFLEKYLSNLKVEFEKSQINRIITNSFTNNSKIFLYSRPLKILSFPLFKAHETLRNLYFQPKISQIIENKFDKIIPQYYGGIHNPETLKNISNLPQKFSLFSKIKSYLFYPFLKFRYGKYEHLIEEIESQIPKIIKNNKDLFSEIKGNIIDIRNIESGDVRRNKIEIKCEIQTRDNSSIKNYFCTMKFLINEKYLIDSTVIEI
ncbi:hypothetical protein SLOPH_932 [Spraguea lophii 42_110]|uniref:Uncharacterized protein n=1 Tax=Spraguea lophii (strain 42_110) TaxID=1358809 RepID=S7WB17_SPRLO|nr:hypothetical protein SLOPH_932 [Spraguea lophii 42_110]